MLSNYYTLLNIIKQRVCAVISEITVALLSFFGTLVGAMAGVVASAKLTNYRLAQLEKKVDRHNSFAERIPLLEERLRLQSARIDNLERNDFNDLRN